MRAFNSPSHKLWREGSERLQGSLCSAAAMWHWRLYCAGLPQITGFIIILNSFCSQHPWFHSPRLPWNGLMQMLRSCMTVTVNHYPWPQHTLCCGDLRGRTVLKVHELFHSAAALPDTLRFWRSGCVHLPSVSCHSIDDSAIHTCRWGTIPST